MAWYLGGNMDTELFLSALIARVDVDKAKELFPCYPEDGDTVVQWAEGMGFDSGDVGELAKLSRLGEPGGLAPYVPGVGSNSWAVSGDLTENGNTLLANDMHLGMWLPSIWYVQHLLLEGEFKVTGVMFPGVPGVIAGFNEYIAWGLTNVGPDVQDLYDIRFDPSGAAHVRVYG